MIDQIHPIVIAIFLGIVGALSRIAVQVYRDKEITQTKYEVLAEVFLGAVGGGIAYSQGEGGLASWALGFVAPDALENLAQDFFN